jgi:hypothetical protein
MSGVVLIFGLPMILDAVPFSPVHRMCASRIHLWIGRRLEALSGALGWLLVQLSEMCVQRLGSGFSMTLMLWPTLRSSIKRLTLIGPCFCERKTSFTEEIWCLASSFPRGGA